MAKTKKEKKEEIDKINKTLEEGNGFLLFGFNGVPAEKLSVLRDKVKESQGKAQVVKRNLFDLCLKDKGIDFEVTPFTGQTAIVSFSSDILDVAGTVYDFVKEEVQEGKILGGYDTKNEEEYSAQYLERVGQLPSREVLLGQLVSGISGPIRSFVYTLKAISEKG